MSQQINGEYCARQLAQILARAAGVAHRAESDAREAARTMATESEKKEDARAILEFGGLAAGQARRRQAALDDLHRLDAFLRAGVPAYGDASTVGVGAVVDLATGSDAGYEERTYVVLPVGAGTEITGPGGDGFLTVITPSSPVGRALLTRRCGDVIDVGAGDTLREWTIRSVG